MTLKYKKEREISVHPKISIGNRSVELFSIRSKIIEERSNCRAFIELCTRNETEFNKLVSGNYSCFIPFIKPKPLRVIKSTTKEFDKYLDDKKKYTFEEFVKYYYFLGESSRKLNYYENSIKICNRGLKAISHFELSVPDYETLLHITKAKASSNKGDPEEGSNSLGDAFKSIKRMSQKDERRRMIEGELYLAKVQNFFIFNEHNPNKKISPGWQQRLSGKKAEECFSKSDNEMKAGYAKYEQLRILRAVGEYGKATELRDEMDEIPDITEKKWNWITWTKFDDFELARLNKDYPLAKKICVEALKGSKRLGNLNRISEAFLGLSEIERQLGHPNRAYFYLLRAKIISSQATDSIWRNRISSEIKELIRERNTGYHQMNFV